MERKKLLLASAATVAISGLALAATFPMVALAESAATGSSFAQILAQKLGIEESKVESALTATRDQLRSQRQAETAEELAQAVKDGKLTQRQADLLLAEMKAHESLRPETGERPQRLDRSELQNLTAEQRKAKLEEMKAQMQAKLLEAMKSQGVTTSIDELDAAREAARKADIGIHAILDHGGPRMGFGPMQ
jgi:hypothetical protein